MNACPHCSGRGEVFGHLNTGDPKTHGFQWFACFRCHGKGTVEATVLLAMQRGEAFREWRVAQGATLRQAASMFDVSVLTISEWERGEKSLPDVVVERMKAGAR